MLPYWYTSHCRRRGEIGRRKGLKIPRSESSVPVRVRSPAPTKKLPLITFGSEAVTDETVSHIFLHKEIAPERAPGRLEKGLGD